MWVSVLIFCFCLKCRHQISCLKCQRTMIRREKSCFIFVGTTCFPNIAFQFGEINNTPCPRLLLITNICYWNYWKWSSTLSDDYNFLNTGLIKTLHYFKVVSLLSLIVGWSKKVEHNLCFTVSHHLSISSNGSGAKPTFRLYVCYTSYFGSPRKSL